MISLRGPTGLRGTSGPTGSGGGGVRTFATVYSDNDPSQGGLQSIRRPMTPEFITSPVSSGSIVPDGVVVDFAGRYYFTSKENSRVYRVETTGAITTIIGTGSRGYYTGNLATGYSVTGTSFQLDRPSAIAINSTRTVLYIADEEANFIVQYDIRTSTASIFDHQMLYTGDLATGYTSKLNWPSAICLGKAPNTSGSLDDVMYIVNLASNRVAQYTFPNSTTGSPSRYNIIAGSGAVGFSGDAGAATSATMRYPRGVCQVVATTSQSVILIADTGNNRVRKVTITGSAETTGTITTVIGSGVLFNLVDSSTEPLGNALTPYGVQYSKARDTVYITSDRRMRAVTNFTVGTPTLRTIMGQTIHSTTDYLNIGGLASAASVSTLYGGIHIDYNGNLLIPGNARYPILCYTTMSSVITLDPPAPIIGDIVNWVTRYDNGSGFKGASQWIYNDYQSSTLSSKTFDSVWTQIGPVVSISNLATTVGVTGYNSDVTGHTGSDGPIVRGPVGPTGDAQTQAPAGPAGPTGRVGITDYNDSVGPTGYDGPDGNIGPTGPDGPSPDGDIGPTGRRGIQGVRHANFYQDLPFPQASTPISNPFPETSLPGDYYIKSNTLGLYHYQETVPANSYYLKRIINTSPSAFGVQGSVGSRYGNIIQTNTATGAAGRDWNVTPEETQAQRNTRLATATAAYNTAESYVYQYQSEDALRNFDEKRFDLDTETARTNFAGRSQLNGSITPWTTANSPYIYEFMPVSTSSITTNYRKQNYYAVLSIDGTFIPGVYVVAGHKNPVFQDTDTPTGNPLYIISMKDLSGNLPYVIYQIFWYTKTIPINTVIPPTAIIAAYLGVAVNKKLTNTAADPTGYNISLFFTNANYGSDNTVQFDNKSKLPDYCETSIMYGLDGYPVLGSNPNQYAWITKHHFGGLIELTLSLDINDVYSESFSIPSNYGLYGLSNAFNTPTNIPLNPNFYTAALVTTVKFPDNDTLSVLPLTNFISKNTISCTNIAVHPTTNDIYFTNQILDSSGALTGETLLRVRSSNVGSDGYTYSAIEKLFSRDQGYSLSPDGTPLADLGCAQMSGIAFDNIGNLYYSDFNNHCVRKIDLITSNPTVSTVAGQYPITALIGEIRPGGSAITGNSIFLRRPRGLCCRQGFLYIADSGNHRIVRIDIANRGLVPFIIGGGQNGKTPGVMNKTIGTLSDVRFNGPYDVKIDASDNLYISDTENHCVWRANIDKNEVVLFVGLWNYTGTPIPQSVPQPPKQMAWWEIFLIVLTVIIVVVAVVATGGAAAPAAASLAAPGGGGGAAVFTGTATSGALGAGSTAAVSGPVALTIPAAATAVKAASVIAPAIAANTTTTIAAAGPAIASAATRYALQIATRTIVQQVSARAAQTGIAKAYLQATTITRTVATTVARTAGQAPRVVRGVIL